MRGLAFLLALLLAMGCELAETDAVEESSSDATTDTQTTTTGTTATTDAASVDADQAEWDAISWHTSSGPSCQGATQVMTLSADIDGSGDSVSFTFSSYPWGGAAGLGHFFWWNGSTWEGGKFDWIRSGGQGVKILENVHGGYNGLQTPASGTAVAFAWTNEDGTERSNLAKTTWP